MNTWTLSEFKVLTLSTSPERHWRGSSESGNHLWEYEKENTLFWVRKMVLIIILIKEIKPINPKGNQPCIGRTDLKLKLQFFALLMQ